MDDQVLGLRVGILVLTAAIVLAILVGLFGPGRHFWTKEYTVNVKFPQAPGVKFGTPVRKSGVLVGRVSGVQLTDDGGVLVTLSLDKSKPVKATEQPRIKTANFVSGDAIIEFVPDLANPTTEQLTDGDFIGTGKVMGDPFEVLVNLESRFTDAFGSIQRAAAEIETAASTASTILKGLQGLGGNRDQIVRVVQKAETALDQFNSTMMAVEDVFGDEELRVRLKTALDDLPTVMTEAKLFFAESRNVVKEFQTVAERVDTNLANLERFTEPLGERGPQIVDNIDNSIRRLDEVLEQLVNMTTAINRQQGTLGKLVYNSEAYDNLNRLMRETDQLMNVQVRAILDNLYIATDKIARDPGGAIGARSMLNRSPTTGKTIINNPR
ncbi:MAG TPA: MCE family protein [Planctomycetes bacterium]|jgi:phospholipid/cholesterol/gamma-HCH transport system substrate-binding protein|nr:MCE family protein [Planctomycetaceae bacterium]HIM29512.1 MCE family protein [Planctomycetota bacterium]